jgi:nucleotide-binding universal stress UspA family protein
MKTIVVGYDETDAAKRALDRAAMLAEKLDAKLVVTSVAPVLLGVGRSMGAIDPTDTLGAHLAELADARAQLAERNVTAEFVPAMGVPAETIVEVAEERGADLIVVGTREPGIIDRLLRGSISEGVARHAHCDVLIVH